MEPCTPNSRELSIVNGAGDYGPTVSKIPEVHARILSGHGGSIPSWGRTGKVKDTETCDVRLIGQIGASEREEYRTRERSCGVAGAKAPPQGEAGRSCHIPYPEMGMGASEIQRLRQTLP